MTDIPDLPVYGFDANAAGLVSFAIAVVLPFVAALLTRQSWSGPVKGSVLLGLAFVKTIAEAWLEAANRGVDFDVLAALWTTGYNFAIAVIAYFGVFRYTGALRKAQESVVTDPSPPAEHRWTGSGV